MQSVLTESLAPPSAVVSARGLVRRYGSGDTAVDALRGVSVDIAERPALASLVMTKWHMPISLPVSTLFAFTMMAVIAGIGAAAMPARRASRLDVLRALQYE